MRHADWCAFGEGYGGHHLRLSLCTRRKGQWLEGWGVRGGVVEREGERAMQNELSGFAPLMVSMTVHT